ncbi:MAG: glycosyltransferase family 4 protein [Deltaproteobacteria bacterium]|nr:glycosyltransferase family 4 protein [Deltaproteobacteria bacterium]
MRHPVVLEISSAMHIGGGEVHFLNLVAGLSRDRFSVSAVVRPKSALIPKLKECSIPVYTLPLRNSLDLVSAYTLRRLSNRLGANIIHAHVGRDYLIAALACAKRCRLVVTRHLLLPMRRSPLHRVCFRKVDRFIAVSQSVKEALIRHEGIDPARVVVIPNGVSVGHLFPPASIGELRERLGIPPGVKVVGIVGQVSPHKGHEDFVEAAARLSTRHPGIIFLVVGEESGNGSFVRKLRSQIIQKGLEKRFFFTGFLEDVSSAMGLMDVLAVPSWEEPFGLVILEAMVAGVPVVATDVGGPGEILENGISGILVSPRAPGELAEAIVSILARPDLCAKLSQNGRVRVEKHYNIDLQVRRTADVFNKLGALQ